jgi:hypothetical protein
MSKEPDITIEDIYTMLPRGKARIDIVDNCGEVTFYLYVDGVDGNFERNMWPGESVMDALRHLISVGATRVCEQRKRDGDFTRNKSITQSSRR